MDDQSKRIKKFIRVMTELEENIKVSREIDFGGDSKEENVNDVIKKNLEDLLKSSPDLFIATLKKYFNHSWITDWDKIRQINY